MTKAWTEESGQTAISQKRDLGNSIYGTVILSEPTQLLPTRKNKKRSKRKEIS